MKTGLLALGRQRLERLVVLVDVQVFVQGDINYSQAYAALIHSCIERILNACNEYNNGHRRTTSWGFKLFDSSLSPMASSSTLLSLCKDSSEGKGLRHISGFKSAEESLSVFKQTLSVVAAEIGSRSSDLSKTTRSKADFVVRALQEVLSDFTWNSVFISDESSSDEDQAWRRRGEHQGVTSFSIQQNLVMVFSHLPENMHDFASFMNMSTSNAAKDTGLFKAFSSKMKRLQEPFRLQGIRACWIDMPRVSTSVVNQCSGLPVSTENDQRQELYSVFSQTKWKYTTMDALAIASDCLPPAMVWSSVAYPDLQVQPNALRMQAKLRIIVQDRDGKQFQPDICRLEAVSVGSNVLGSALVKESVSAILKMGSLSSKAELSSSGICPSLQPPVVKIVVKSLLPKQDVLFKCSLRYLLHHRGTNSKTKNKMASAEEKVQKVDPFADDAASDASGHDILKQLQQEPMSFEPGERAWQLLLIAIARKKSVAEVDVYVDGDCSSAILEPITVQYAALLQKDHSSKILSSDCNKQTRVQHGESKSLVSSPLLIVKTEVTDLGSECRHLKQEIRSRKRTAATIPVEESPLVKRKKLVGGFNQKSSSAEEINHSRREAFSWVQHWRHIVRRKTVGTGKVQIENRYMRSRMGRKPSKAIQIIKCWLDQVSKLEPLAEQQLVPFSAATPGQSEPVIEERILDGGLDQVGASERIESTDHPVVPMRDKEFFSAVLDTEEQAESYLSSVEQMLQDCLQSDAGDLLVFVKGVMSNAARAQRILLKKKETTDLVHPLAENLQCAIKDDFIQVHRSAQKNTEGPETVKPCNSDSSCVRNVLKAEKADYNKPGIVQETLCSVSGVGNGAIPDSNCIDYGGSSDGADSACQMALIVHCVGSRNQQEATVEATDESQPNSNESILSEMVAEQLMDKLLVKPKKLAKQYKDRDSATSEIAHIRKEKLRAYELQILFRMELIERDCGGPIENEKTKILKEICRLLDDIQFDLGGVFGSASLHDYSIRVIHNRYKERLPQTVADVFERMEFNGYVEGMSELQSAPDSTHAPVNLVGSHDPKETEKEEFIDKLDLALDAATRPMVQPEQPVEGKIQIGAAPTSTKGRTQAKPRRKRSVPMDAFTRATEKRKLASRLTHFGGRESLHRLKKVKIHHHSPKPKRVSSPTKEKYQSKEHNVVLETPRFERQNVRAETPKIVDVEDEAESICTRVVTSTFGFGTPAKVSKHMQPTMRKRRLALFNQKKPPGRGLPRIAHDVMKAMAEDETMRRPAKPVCQLDVELRAHNECAGESSSMYVSQSFQEHRLPNPGWRRQPSADVLKDARAATFDSTDLRGWVLRESGDQGKPEHNEGTRHTGFEELAPSGQAHSLDRDAILETQIIQENSWHSLRVSATQVGIQQQADLDFNSGMLMNSSMPISIKKNRRKSLHTFKSKKLDCSSDCSKPQNSTPAIQVLSPPAADRDIFGLASAAEEPVQRVEMSDVALNSQPVDLTSSENRWDDDEIPCLLPTEVPMNCVSAYENAQHTLVETHNIELAGDSERNCPSTTLAKRHEFFSASPSEELASRPLLKASISNFSELAGETEVLFETQIVEEVHFQEHRLRSPRRALNEDALCFSPSDAPTTWEMPCMDLNGTQDLEREGRVGISLSTEKLASSGSCNLHTTPPFRINRTSKVCRGDPPSSPFPHRLAAEHDIPLVKTPGLIAEDSSVDLDFTQIMNEIFHSTGMMEKASAEECRGRSLGDAGEWIDEYSLQLDEYSLLLDENWSPSPRLKPEPRLSGRTPSDFQRKNGALDEDTVAAITGGSPLKFSSPTLNRKFRRPLEGSPGQYPNTPNALGNCKKRSRSVTASPKETPKGTPKGTPREKHNKMLRFI